MRHAEAEDRDNRKHLVEHPSVIERGQSPECRAERKPEQRRGHGKDERVAERVQQLAGNLQSGKNGGAEIAMYDPAQPCKILDIQWLVEAKLHLQPLDDLLR